MILDNKVAFEQHCLVSSSVVQKVGLLRMSFEVFGHQSGFQKCFDNFISPCLEYRSPVWCFAVDSHLGLLDGNFNAIRFLIPDFSVALWYRCSKSSLCMLFRIYHNPKHPLYLDLLGLFCPAWITGDALSFKNHAFCVERPDTTRFSRNFIPAVTVLWNDLLNLVADSVQLQKFLCDADEFRLSKFFCNVLLLYPF